MGYFWTKRSKRCIYDKGDSYTWKLLAEVHVYNPHSSRIFSKVAHGFVSVWFLNLLKEITFDFIVKSLLKTIGKSHRDKNSNVISEWFFPQCIIHHNYIMLACFWLIMTYYNLQLHKREEKLYYIIFFSSRLGINFTQYGIYSSS